MPDLGGSAPSPSRFQTDTVWPKAPRISDNDSVNYLCPKAPGTKTLWSVRIFRGLRGYFLLASWGPVPLGHAWFDHLRPVELTPILHIGQQESCFFVKKRNQGWMIKSSKVVPPKRVPIPCPVTGLAVLSSGAPGGKERPGPREGGPSPLWQVYGGHLPPDLPLSSVSTEDKGTHSSSGTIKHTDWADTDPWGQNIIQAPGQRGCTWDQAAEGVLGQPRSQRAHQAHWPGGAHFQASGSITGAHTW